jgi:hypothetical protein
VIYTYRYIYHQILFPIFANNSYNNCLCQLTSEYYKFCITKILVFSWELKYNFIKCFSAYNYIVHQKLKAGVIFAPYT